jgi:hypothetical protein
MTILEYISKVIAEVDERIAANEVPAARKVLVSLREQILRIPQPEEPERQRAPTRRTRRHEDSAPELDLDRDAEGQ